MKIKKFDIGNRVGFRAFYFGGPVIKGEIVEQDCKTGNYKIETRDGFYFRESTEIVKCLPKG